MAGRPAACHPRHDKLRRVFNSFLPTLATPLRNFRVIKNDRHENKSVAHHDAPHSSLANDSLGWSLLLASRVLAAVYQGKSLNEALGLLGEELPPARAAAQDVAYGVLRQFCRGDIVLGQLMQKPLTHAETRALLHAALYRLETRPEAAHTVVDQAVKAAGELAGGVFKGVVNGVLRNYLRRREELLAKVMVNEEAHYQHPNWWLARLRRRWPQQWESIVAADNGAPPMTLRVNRGRASVDAYRQRLESVGMLVHPVGSNGLRLEQAVPVDQLPGFLDGDVSVQDAGAQRAAELLAPDDGMRVLDACAAPGGKAAHLAELANIELLALDIDAVRVRRIEDTFRRLHLAGDIRVGDAAQPATWWDGLAFDLILADVPCSGSGVVRRHPDIKLLRRESDIRQFAKTQAAILDALWSLLKPGGRLLYATCSVFVEENQAQIDAFAVRQSGVLRLSEEQWLPCDENDGFYYALLGKAD